MDEKNFSIFESFDVFLLLGKFLYWFLDDLKQFLCVVLYCFEG